ncbi:type III-A CRISPR-associated protein Csm2 [Persephonella atlantica]|uniref:CRISPR system Cms protein Csm2 n=1 Tax=Persephonella atlantica TaxID=2699429 RepID=A0ABS1GI66_9AQUI|nr:type III-A CRISPR-associated protein Csm2 [Persephonella atlantica]MBK3332629.1 type III-A CRISPR-associated protein Csm2 [Persephonella atlantica]
MNSTDIIQILTPDLVSNIKELIKLRQEISKLEKQKNYGEAKKKKNVLRGIYRNLVEETIKMIQGNNITLSNIDEEEFIKPEGICEGIATGITFKRTQLRKFFAEIKLIQEKTKSDEVNSIDITKLIPKLAYSQARGLIDDEFFKLMKELLNKVRKTKKKSDYDKFVTIFESIIAYHHYYNPKED